MYDIATAAVEAALAAGASYADARVMESRTEAMAARNGAIESLDREAIDRRIGLHQLLGSRHDNIAETVEYRPGRAEAFPEFMPEVGDRK